MYSVWKPFSDTSALSRKSWYDYASSFTNYLRLVYAGAVFLIIATSIEMRIGNKLGEPRF